MKIPVYIIREKQRREEERRRREEEASRIPLFEPSPEAPSERPAERENDRNVIVVQM